MNRVEAIVDMINRGIPASEIATQTGCHVQNVYETARRYGLRIKSTRRKAKGYDAQIKQMREAGYNYTQISKTTGIGTSTVRGACKRLGCELTESERRNITLASALAGGRATADKLKHTEEDVAELIKQANKGVEYVGEYTNNKGTVLVKCVTCSAEFSVTYQTAVSPRAGKINCLKCREIKQAQAETEKEERRAQRELDRMLREQKRKEAKAEQERKKAECMHACAVCGKITDNPKYCSKQCANKAYHKATEIRRRMRYKGGDNITVEALARRDGNVCYICGLAVNENDFVERDGTFIAGNYYPSIDHVIPISHGGKHKWDNVKLAHRICNMAKSDKLDFVLSPAPIF